MILGENFREMKVFFAKKGPPDKSIVQFCNSSQGLLDHTRAVSKHFLINLNCDQNLQQNQYLIILNVY